MNIEKQINTFRIASRELFNNYFLNLFLENNDWDFYEKYTCIEEELFDALVASRIGIKTVPYGCYEQPEILVIPTTTATCGIPIMLNRETNSGYWDHPINMAHSSCVFSFIKFFDWDHKTYKDNRYVKVVVKDWPGHLELVGKQALIESIYVSYCKA